MAGVSTMSIIGTVPGVIAAPLVVNRIGKKKVCVTGILVFMVGPALRIIFGSASLPLAYVGTFLGWLGAGLLMPMQYGIQADNTLWVQYTTGKHAEAAIASLSSFITKVAQGIAGSLPGFVLAACGYAGGAAEQVSAVTGGIIACVLVVPALLNLLGAIVFIAGYKVTAADVDMMAKEIAAREGKV